MNRRDERGAIFPMTVLFMGVIVLIASLVIDVGGDRLVRRDMQSMADVIALDVVRQLDGRTAAAYAGYDAAGPSTALLATAKNESLARQDSNLADPDTVGVRLAVADKNSGAFVRWASAGDIPNAVRVWTTGSSAFRFLPSTTRRTNLERSALAVMGRPIACISAGATLADLTPQGKLDTLLGRLLGVDRLTVLDPAGVAALGVQVPLLDLAAKLGVGSVDELATVETSAQGFILAMSEVLSSNGNAASVSLFSSIVTHLPNNTSLDVGEILSLDTGNGRAAGLGINAFSLLQSVIMVSNKENFVSIGQSVSSQPEWPTNVPGFPQASIQAKMIEAPQSACGPVGTTARSAQIQVKIRGDLTALGGLVASAEIDPLFMTVADGSGTITNITCSGGVRTVSVLANTSVGTVGVNLLTELLLKLTRLKVGAPDPAAKPDGAAIGSTSSQAMNFTFPEGSGLPPAQTAGTAFGNLGLSSITPIKIDVTGLPVGGLLDSIVKPLLNVIDPLVSTYLSATLTSLGVNLGTVRIQPSGRPSCNEPFLRD
ncbi:MAG TPA: hypothetical protein VMZ66_04450 [Aeromicrobium sp.]|nr:hypothetical protein [Aeromicrobium sp.]